MGLFQARVKSHVTVNETAFLLELSCPDIVDKIQPGQFVQLKCNDTLDPLLRRPFGVHKIDKDNGSMFIYYGVVGVGTELLKKYKVDDKLSLIGPLGNGFELKRNKDIVVIGGGMGIAPMLFLAEELYARGNRIIVVLGAGDSEGLNIRNSFASFAEDMLLATDDGSLGYHGLVTEPLKELLRDKSFDMAYACGSPEMLKGVKAIVDSANISCQVSMEARMACGVGVCLGCACKGSNNDYYPKVCIDGPVFWTEEVDLNA